MTLEQLKIKLSKYATIQICSQQTVFTLLMTGENLTSMVVVSAIQNALLEYAESNYPILECMRNDESFLCIVLAPEKDEQTNKPLPTPFSKFQNHIG